MRITLLLTVCALFSCTYAQIKLRDFKWENPPVFASTAATNPSNSAQTAPALDVYYGGFSGIVNEGYVVLFYVCTRMCSTCMIFVY